MSFRALESAWREAQQGYQRSHVTPYLYETPSYFKVLSVTGDEDYSSHRWTVDTPEDLEFVRAVYSRRDGGQFRLSDVLRLIKSEPHLAEINRSVAQKAMHEG
jgi:spore coat polysaccharide biosynthesis protein SpsF